MHRQIQPAAFEAHFCAYFLPSDSADPCAGAWFYKLGAITGAKRRFLVLEGRELKYYKRVSAGGTPCEQMGTSKCIRHVSFFKVAPWQTAEILAASLLTLCSTHQLTTSLAGMLPSPVFLTKATTVEVKGIKLLVVSANMVHVSAPLFLGPNFLWGYSARSRDVLILGHRTEEPRPRVGPYRHGRGGGGGMARPAAAGPGQLTYIYTCIFCLIP